MDRVAVEVIHRGCQARRLAMPANATTDREATQTGGSNMGMGLRPTESATGGLRRIFIEQVSAALAQLDKRPLTDRATHDARKKLKMARATLRLLRPALGAAYKRGNAAVRDAARPLSALRDSRVLIDTLDSLEPRRGDPTRTLRTDAFRRLLRQERARLRASSLATAGGLRRPRAVLKRLVARAARWRIADGEWEVPRAGLRRVYAQGRRGLKTAAAGDAKELHDWRKSAKYLWHQLQLLQPLRQRPIGQLAGRVHKLSDHLGDDHDLYVLRGKVADARRAFRSPADQRALLALIERRRKRLQHKAIRIGRRIYAEKPADFERRFGRYWRAWRATSK
jgi:CHAD domain-containing protein